MNNLTHITFNNIDAKSVSFGVLYPTQRDLGEKIHLWKS